MSDAATNAKLDRILTYVAHTAEEQEATRRDMTTLIAALVNQDVTLRAIVEHLRVLTEHMTAAKPESDMRELLAAIQESLARIQEDGAALLGAVVNLPAKVGQSVQEAMGKKPADPAGGLAG